MLNCGTLHFMLRIETEKAPDFKTSLKKKKKNSCSLLLREWRKRGTQLLGALLCTINHSQVPSSCLSSAIISSQRKTTVPDLMWWIIQKSIHIFAGSHDSVYERHAGFMNGLLSSMVKGLGVFTVGQWGQDEHTWPELLGHMHLLETLHHHLTLKPQHDSICSKKTGHENRLNPCRIL